MSATLYMMLGYPGAGKTTLANRLAEITGAVRLSSDELRLVLFPEPSFTQTEHDQLYRVLDFLTELLLQSGVSVIYDANLNRFQHREPKYQLAKKLHIHAQLFWVQAAKDLARGRRMDEQEHCLVPPFETPEHMFERIVDVFEAPHDNEAYIAVDGTKITPEYVQKLLETQ